jgi:hypothetical protein
MGPCFLEYWRIVQILRQRQRKMTNTGPTIPSAVQASSQPTFIINNYTPLVISRNDKNNQLTLLSHRKLALTTIIKHFAL